MKLSFPTLKITFGGRKPKCPVCKKAKDHQCFGNDELGYCLKKVKR